MPRKSNRKSKGASTAPKGRQQTRKSSPAPTMGGPRSVLKNYELPISFYTSNADATSANIGPAPARAGTQGIRIRGNQPLLSILGYSGIFDLFYQAGSLAYVNPNTCPINPVSMRGRLASIASGYERYVFRNIRFQYVTSTTSNYNSGGQMAMCFQADGNIDTDTPQNYLEVRQVTPSVAFPAFAPTALVDYKYNGDQLFYCSNTATDSIAANLRQKFQGLFIAYCASVGSTPSITLGYIDVSYTIDLYYPTFTQYLTLSSNPSIAATAMLLEELDRKERQNKVKVEDPHAKALAASREMLRGVEEKTRERASAEACSGEDDLSMVMVPPLGGTSELGSNLPLLLKLLKQQGLA
nr:MAG: hypothetical protein [Narnaviridae sp.]